MKKGFTLIELMAVIIILGVVLVIVTTNVTGILSRSKDKLNSEQQDEIINAARQWGMRNVTINGSNPSLNYVTIDTLQKSGYLDNKDIKDLTTGGIISKDTKICIIYDNNQLEYEYKGSC